MEEQLIIRCSYCSLGGMRSQSCLLIEVRKCVGVAHVMVYLRDNVLIVLCLTVEMFNRPR